MLWVIAKESEAVGHGYDWDCKCILLWTGRPFVERGSGVIVESTLWSGTRSGIVEGGTAQRDDKTVSAECSLL